MECIKYEELVFLVCSECEHIIGYYDNISKDMANKCNSNTECPFCGHAFNEE